MLIYNLFPRHYPTVHGWAAVIPHVKEMGFNSIFVNPFHATGFSGSLYAVQDYYKLNPIFLHPDEDPTDWSPLRSFVTKCAEAGLRVIMDLVINHTAKDSPLVKEHPQWYRWNEDGSIMNPYAVNIEDGTITVWGDLAMIANNDSPDRRNLWKYWDELIAFFQRLGIYAFRCDAAYQVPAALWKMLIRNAKRRISDTLFLAETLGCSPQQTLALKGSGFDYLFNSSKYWNFDQPWCLEQHEEYQRIAPSISFPESHDTPRLASEKPGHLNWQKNRYVLAAFFSKGLMMTAGYEYGAVRRMDVVSGTPANVEAPRWDLRRWIAAINAFKLSQPVLCEEGHWRAASTYEWDLLFLEKRIEANEDSIVLLFNKDWYHSRTVERSEIPSDLKRYQHIIRLFRDELTVAPLPDQTFLDAAEAVALVR